MMEQIEVKKPTKYKPPVIRQTLTSIYRIAKANPLLFIDNEPGSLDLKSTKLPESLKPLSKKPTGNGNPNDTKPIQFSKPTPKPIPKPSLNKNVNGFNNNKTTFNRPSRPQTRPPLKLSQVSKPKVNVPKQTPLKKTLVASNQPKVNFAKPSETKVNTHRVKKRRSLSADHFERKKNVNANLHSLTNSQKNNDNNLNCFSPIVERRVKFQSPEISNEPSVKYTSTPYVRRPSCIVRTNYQLSDLHQRLTEWLKLHRKSFGSYQCLKAFSLKSEENKFDDENKENVENDCPINSSYEDLRIKDPVTPHREPENLQEVTRGVLKDLNKLILEGFSVEQSEAWLNVISQKYGFLEDEPLYWECRAAIEQNRGNIAHAVDFLRTAIVHGAEVQSIDGSLEQLLQKFSLLNINTPGRLGDEMKNDRARIVEDARNIFKSSIIKFAVQERDIKKNALNGDGKNKFVATPVRRSTRLTPSRYRYTPKVQLYASLQDLDESVKTNMDFCSNSQLKVRFSSAKKKKD